MKISIVGHGFVGKALENGINDDSDIQIIDPKYKTKSQIYLSLILISYSFVFQRQ